MVRNLSWKIVFLTIALAGSVFTNAHASVYVDLQTQIANLLAEVYNLKARLSQIVQQPQAPQNTATTTVKYFPSDMSCLILPYDLDPGDQNYYVTLLQMFLARDGYIYPEARVTGYYDLATQRAVQRYQIKHSIVTWGSPNTTGFGRVGPKTREVMARGCETLNATSTAATTTSSSTDSVTQPSDVLLRFDAQPVLGGSPLDVYAKFTLKNQCVAYQLDWGDKSAPVVYIPHLDCDMYKPKEVILNHIYPTRGVYTIKLRATDDESKFAGNQTKLFAPLVAYKAIPVGMERISFSLDKTEGVAPLAVHAKFTLTHPSCTSYVIDWGDGSTPDMHEISTTTVAFLDQNGKIRTVNSTACSFNPITKTQRHVYEAPGVYTVTFRAGQTRLTQTPLLEQWVVRVSPLPEGERVVDIHPQSGKAPLTVNVKLVSKDNPCASYMVDWGDGSGVMQAENVMQDVFEFNEDDFVFVDDYYTDENASTTDPYAHCKEPFSIEFAHTYLAPGVYPLRVKLGRGPLSEIKEIMHFINVGY